MKKKILIIISIICTVCIVEAAYNRTKKEEISSIDNVKETSASTETVAVQESVENDSTTVIPALLVEDEKKVEKQVVEDESFELQGEIAYEGAKAKSWCLDTDGKPQLTYISQIDSRWSSHRYTSIGDSSQTIGSSGCGVASAAMIIDGIVGKVSVIELADTFVANGFRSANSGTYWSAYRAVADQFDIPYRETSNFDTMLSLLRNNHYIIASCGNGLFTYGGHYIVLYGVEGDTIKIYDPYLYGGKFDVSTRRGKVSMQGNTVYCSISNFKKYSNYKQFFCYGYEAGKVNPYNNTDSEVVTLAYTRYVKVKTSLNVRNAPNGRKIGSLYNNNQVNVYEVVNGWARIGSNRWVSNAYLYSYSTGTSSVKSYSNGTYIVNCSRLNVRTGPSIKYRKKSLRELTASARRQGGYVRGVRCTVYEIKNGWGRTPSGWICLAYCRKI